MRRVKISEKSFEGQPIYVGINYQKKSWKVTIPGHDYEHKSKEVNKRQGNYRRGEKKKKGALPFPINAIGQQPLPESLSPSVPPSLSPPVSKSPSP